MENLKINITKEDTDFLKKYRGLLTYNNLILFKDKKDSLNNLKLWECHDSLFKHSISFSEGLRLYNSKENEYLNYLKFILSICIPNNALNLKEPDYPYEEHNKIMDQLSKKYKQCKPTGPVGSVVKRLLEVEGKFTNEDGFTLHNILYDHSIVDYYNHYAQYKIYYDHKNLFGIVELMRNYNAKSFFEQNDQLLG